MRHTTSFFRMVLLTATALVAGQSTAVLADPLENEILKFQQLPLNNSAAPSTGGSISGS